MGALQAAIDMAPQAGAAISVNGECGATTINGKSNISITGGVISGGLQIEASRNIQLSDMVIDAAGEPQALLISYTSSVLTNGNITITGILRVRSNSSFNQLSGNINVTGIVQAFQSGTLFIRNGTLNGGAVLTRNSSLFLFPDSPSHLINFSGTMQAYSGANITAQANNLLNHGSIDIIANNVFVQRSASMQIFGSAQDINKISFEIISGGLNVRQNGAFDLLWANINIDFIKLTDGGGARIFVPGVETIHADCDDSGWASSTLTCDPPPPPPSP
jgi:hypothetical protein